MYTIFFFFKILFIFRVGKERRERNINVPPTGNLAHNPGMCPDWESNWSELYHILEP